MSKSQSISEVKTLVTGNIKLNMGTPTRKMRPFALALHIRHVCYQNRVRK